MITLQMYLNVLNSLSTKDKTKLNLYLEHCGWKT